MSKITIIYYYGRINNFLLASKFIVYNTVTHLVYNMKSIATMLRGFIDFEYCKVYKKTIIFINNKNIANIGTEF